MKIPTLLLSFSLFFAICAQAQQLLPNTINPNNAISEPDSTLNEDEELKADCLKTADETLYKNIWNCTQIKYPANTLPPKDEIITINLIGPNDNPFVMPVKGPIISKFGKRGRRIHTGTDIRLNSGDTVRCAFDGRVRLAKRFSGYGNLVLVRHNNGLETIYGHLKAINVKVNDTIKAGDLIGLGGRTGRATCNHLHFETRLYGEPFDSNKYIDFETFALNGDNVFYRNKQFEIDQDRLRMKSAPEIRPVLASKADAARHTIRSGDNLWVIAKKYNTTVKKLCVNNNITAQKTLKVGSVLRIN
jgi:hypothetical protein